jgi:hypothetical protein
VNAGSEPEDLVRSVAEEISGESEGTIDADAYIDRAIELVDAIAGESIEPSHRTLLAASTSLLLAARGPQSIGQCKEKTPFAPIYIVFDAGGHRYECTHDPPHSSPL